MPARWAAEAFDPRLKNVPSVAGRLKDQPRDRHHNHGNKDGDRNPQELPAPELEDGRRQVRHPLAAGDENETAAEDAQGAQGGDDGGNARLDDKESVNGAEEAPGEDGRADEDDRMRPLLRQFAGDGAADGEDRAGGDVDFPGDDDPEHADGDEDHVGCAYRHVPDVRDGEKAGILDSRGDGENHDNHRNGNLAFSIVTHRPSFPWCR